MEIENVELVVEVVELEEHAKKHGTEAPPQNTTPFAWISSG